VKHVAFIGFWTVTLDQLYWLVICENWSRSGFYGSPRGGSSETFMVLDGPMQQFFEQQVDRVKAQGLSPQQSRDSATYRATKEGIKVSRWLPRMHGKTISLP
jgi:hypothetical protein